MKIIMTMVMTADGKITKWQDLNIYKWTSKEDQNFFFSLIKKNNLIVMGSKTYDAVQKNIKLQDKKLRIVLTKNPQKYSSDQIPNKLEFSNETPKKLITRLEKRGYKKILLVGGGVVNAAFLKSNLVDELYLTIEPKIFGQGKPLVAEENLNKSLKLISLKRLNKEGTLLLKYEVNKDK